MSSLFLSHSHSDKPFARKLAADMRHRGYVVWIDEAEIKVGDSLIQKIREGLDEVDYIAAILSEASLGSEWVQKELDIASNREIDEKRVVVLPLLVEDVELPGFLKGKYYCDFRQEENYETELDKLADAMGPVPKPPAISKNELETLKQELGIARQAVLRHQGDAERARNASFRQKSPELQAKILEANEAFPLHVPINTAYAFQVGRVAVTLDYLLWCIAKSNMRGHPHQIEMLLDIEGKWDDAKAMLEAYKDLLDSQ